jgi:hypothetical protein
VKGLATLLVVADVFLLALAVAARSGRSWEGYRC